MRPKITSIYDRLLKREDLIMMRPGDGISPMLIDEIAGHKTLFDLEKNHKLTFKAVVTATRPSTKTFVKSIYCFETLSSTENNFSGIKVNFNPNLYFDISKYINKKIKLLKIYKNEIRSYPHSRSLEGIKVLAKYRGAQIGVKYAEAFFILRELR